MCNYPETSPITGSLVCSIARSLKGEEDMEECEENPRTPSETTPPPAGPSGLVIFGQLVQKHSYVSGLIIMMVSNTTNSWLTVSPSAIIKVNRREETSEKHKIF